MLSRLPAVPTLPARFPCYTRINHFIRYQWDASCTRNALAWIVGDVMVLALCVMALRVIVA